jgi:hypothetical protein
MEPTPCTYVPQQQPAAAFVSQHHTVNLLDQHPTILKRNQWHVAHMCQGMSNILREPTGKGGRPASLMLKRHNSCLQEFTQRARENHIKLNHLQPTAIKGNSGHKLCSCRHIIP